MANQSLSASGGSGTAVGAAARTTIAADPAALKQFLTFALGTETFAMPIESIREIIEFGGLTTVPLMPDFLRGVINLRGAVVPVIDLSARFARDSTAIGRRTCIVIMELQREDGIQALGIIVDAVNEVLSVDEHDIEPRPSFGAKIRADFITGIIRHQEHFVIALDVKQVLSVDEIASIAEVALGEGVAAENP